jgi:hypothetical protein
MPQNTYAESAETSINRWYELFDHASKDAAFKQRLQASPLGELKAMGLVVKDAATSEAIDTLIRYGLDNPAVMEGLARLAGRGSMMADAAATDPGYLAVTPNWWGLVFTLSPQACNDLLAGVGIGGAVAGAVAAIPAAAPVAAPIALAFGLAAGAISLCNRGKGVYITLLWASLVLPAIPIIPTPVL